MRLMAVCSVAALAGTAAADPNVVGFNSVRGGVTNIVSGQEFDQLRAALIAVHPSTTFRGVSPLTDINSADDIVILASGSGSVTAITPLSAAEQTALLNFVLAGGSAIICVDNDTFNGAASDAANESLLDPFGLDVTGTGLPWSRTASVTAPASPVMNGPYGVIATHSVGWSGWFNTVGPAGSVIARLNDNSQPNLVEVPCGTLGPGSGRVVLFSDTTMLIDTYVTANNLALLKNAYVFVSTPCPSACDSIDFNADGLFPDTADIDDFLSVFSGGPCSTGTCGDTDFNNDGLFPDTLDIDSLLSVFSGGACL